MIKGFLKRRTERKSIREWQSFFLGKALTSHTNEYFKKYPRLADFSEETKNKLVGDFFQAVFGHFTGREQGKFSPANEVSR